MDAAGMQHILEDTEVRGTVLKFANLSSDLLAYGSLDGVVRIAQLGASCKICHVSSCLTTEVAQQDKSCLMVSQDGTHRALLHQRGDGPVLSYLQDAAFLQVA